jgi:hypothetical protein
LRRGIAALGSRTALGGGAQRVGRLLRSLGQPLSLGLFAGFRTCRLLLERILKFPCAIGDT